MLRVERLSSPGKFHDVSFTVRAGEIVGLAGLVGSGRSELAQAVFGLDKAARGTIAVDGRPLGTGSVPTAMRAGLALVPEDRKHQGLILPLSVRANFSITMLERFRRFGLIDARAERRAARESFDRFDIRAPSVETPAEALSGGNQQKIVLAKWLARRSKVLLVDEPTRGVDVGAKAAIHALIDRLARDGLAILLISSELPEVLNLSTRLLVMRAGRLVGNLARDEATQDRVLRLMAGVAAQNAVA
jgi:ABC-type sugar transport system ATPase subunit